MPEPASKPTRRLALEAGPDTLIAAVDLGISGVPIDGNGLLADGVDATLEPLRARGLVPCQVGAFFFNPLHPDPAARAEGLARMNRLIPLAAQAGCPWIAFAGGSRCADVFGGFDPGNLTSDALDEAARELAPLAALAATHDVKLTLEPHLRTLLATPERAADLCARVDSPALRVTFDVTNFYDFAALVDPADMIERCRTALTPWCGLVHLKEIALANGFHLHAGLAPIGQGRTDWSQVLAAAAPGMSEKSWILVEHCANAVEAAASVDHIRRAADRAGISLT